MNTDRRGFLKGLLALSAGTFIPAMTMPPIDKVEAYAFYNGRLLFSTKKEPQKIYASKEYDNVWEQAARAMARRQDQIILDVLEKAWTKKNI